MAYYRIIDTTLETKDREYLLSIGAAHYGTVMSDISVYRKFAKDMTEDELLVLKLTLNHTADISPLSEPEIDHLKEVGYLK